VIKLIDDIVNRSQFVLPPITMALCSLIICPEILLDSACACVSALSVGYVFGALMVLITVDFHKSND